MRFGGIDTGYNCSPNYFNKVLSSGTTGLHDFNQPAHCLITLSKYRIETSKLLKLWKAFTSFDK